jgi:hypothetical protein
MRRIATMNMTWDTHNRETCEMPGQAAIEALKELKHAGREPLLKSVFSTLERIGRRLIPDD